jgi:hypothetical protein
VLPLDEVWAVTWTSMPVYYFVHDGKQRTLKPMQDDQIKSDVELVVHKEKLRKAKPKSGVATCLRRSLRSMMHKASMLPLFQPCL